MRYLFLFLILLLASSCYYDSEEYLFPQISQTCDTTNVSFTNSVQPVLENNCYSCHSNNTAAQFGNNIKLEDYDDVKLRVDDGRLLGSILHEGGYSPMPKGGSMLDDCSVELMTIWIDNGAPNN
jgi:hypothetical protein